MAPYGDERRALAQIERCLADDDPLFAVRMAAGQRRMRIRAGIPFYGPLCVLLTVVAVVLLVVLAGALADGGNGTPEPTAPASQVADDRPVPLVEPR